MEKNYNVTVHEQTFTTAEKAQARANIGAISTDEQNSVILEWDGTSRLYDDIEEAVGDGKVVFIKKGKYYYTPIEATADERFCFVSMMTYYVVYYLEFYPNTHSTGFTETTWTNATAKTYTSSMTDEAIYTGTDSYRSKGLLIFSDSNTRQYIFGARTGSKFYYYAINPQGPYVYYEFSRSGSSPNYTYSRRAVEARVCPIVKYIKTSSSYNSPKVVRVCLCILDKFADDSIHTAQQAEFEIQCTTGATTPNGNANSSFSMRVLVTARDNGGPIKVDCRITSNNDWDFVNAEPTISAYDTNNGNGVIVYFGLMKNGVWQDFEQTYVTLVNLKPDVETEGTMDSVKSYADPTWHPNTLYIPTCTAADASKSLVVNGTGDGLEWAQRVYGTLVENDGNGGVTSSDIKKLYINTNVGNAALLRVTPAGGSVQIIGYLAPAYSTSGDEGKLLCVNSSGTDLEWANPPFIKHDITRVGSHTHLNPYTEEWPIFDGEMTFKMEWTAGGGYLGPSAGTPYLKGKVVTASGWTAYIHVSKGASGNMTYQETSIVHGTSNNTYVNLSQCDYGNGFKVNSDTYPMVVNIDIQYVKSANIYRIGHLTWMKTDEWTYLHTTYDG